MTLLLDLQNLLTNPIVILIAVAALITLIRKYVPQLFYRFMFLVYVVFWAFSMPAALLWKPTSSFARRRFLRFPERFASRLEHMGTRRGDLLRLGRREEAARAWWRESAFPFLYRPVPEDIRRPLHEDGKLVGGVGLPWLADRHMTAKALSSAVEAGLVVGLMLMLLPVAELIWLAFKTGLSLTRDLSVPLPPVEQWPGQLPVLAPQSWWTGAALQEVGWSLPPFLNDALNILIAWSLFAMGGAILGAFTALRTWMWEKGLPYTLISKDADVRWGNRIESRNLSNAVYIKQIELSEGFLLDTPRFKLGEATGISRLRGDLAAPVRGQEMCLDGESLFQHLLVFGGTGEGKTSAILKPLMRQLMKYATHGFYVTDAKGVLWRDALTVAQAVGRQDSVLVIGTGDGQFGVDPIAKLTPTQVASTLRSVLRQFGGDGKDGFWQDMAVNILRHVLTLAMAYKLTEAGQAEHKSGLNPYSLWWAYQTALSRDKLAAVIGSIRALGEEIDAEIGDLIEEGKRDPSRRKAAGDRIRQLASTFSTEARASVEYLETTWAVMAPETKSGIVANITRLLDGFAGAQVLRERFACGRSDANTIELTKALEGSIVLNALSSIEDGLPARLVLIMLKTTLYREARVREASFKAMTPKKDPQKFPCVVLMDEVQEIVTSDPASGLSDATFWNVARSTGLAGIFATQTLAALNQALGPEAAGNFVQQARSKVFFRSEDTDTLEYACWCAGEFERNLVFEDGQRESIDHRKLLDGWDPFTAVDQTEQVRGGAELLRSIAGYIQSPTSAAIEQTRRRNVYEPDFRFVAQLPPPGADDTSTVITAIQMMQAATWRAEDLDRDYRSKGNELRKVVTPTDLINMGRWHAFAHIQRAGTVRQDIMVVKHDHS